MIHLPRPLLPSAPGVLRAAVMAAAIIVLQPLMAADAQPRPASGVTTDAVLEPGDLLQVIVFQEEDLKRDARISQEHSIDLPLIGVVNLRGKTRSEAANIIRDLYRDKKFLVNPQVTVHVMEYSKKFVNVMGSVNEPGAIQFPPEQGLTLIDAITRAGGFSRLANRKTVTLTRTVEGKTERRVVNAEAIQNGEERDIPLTKDDVINVPERLM